MANFLERITATEQNELEELLARAIYASGTTLSIVEHPQWKIFFDRLRPALKLPSRFVVSNRLLNVEFNRISAIVAEEITNSQSLALTCDG